MGEYDFDLFVIGGGSGGVRAARRAASHGARVAIAEEYRWGGTCVIRGCIPKKLLVYAAHYRDDFADAAGFGWTVSDARHDWPALIAAKDAEVERLSRIYVDLLRGSSVEVIAARATLVDAHTVAVGDDRLTARVILIATGSRPFLPDIPGIDHAMTSNEVFRLGAVPRRVAIVGGGYIALEFACILRGLGSEATILYRGDRLLRGFDGDVRDAIGDRLRRKGIGVVCECDVTAIEPLAGGGLRVAFGGGGGLEVDAVLYATGRVPNTRGLGLEAAGIELGARGELPVNARLQTQVPNVYGLGDCIGHTQLTPVAIREAMVFADGVFGGRPADMDYSLIPTAVFSSPPVAMVGATEDEARAAGGEVDVYRAEFRPLKHTLSGRDEKVLVKLVVDAGSQRVLGVHMVGMDAPEIVQMAAVALTMGATKADFDRTIALHPTTAEELVLLRTPS